MIYRITQPLEFVNRALVVFEVPLPCMRVEFEQKLVAPIEAQVWGPFFDTQLDELGVRHLKTHLQGEAIGMCLQTRKMRSTSHYGQNTDHGNVAYRQYS